MQVEPPGFGHERRCCLGPAQPKLGNMVGWAAPPSAQAPIPIWVTCWGWVGLLPKPHAIMGKGMARDGLGILQVKAREIGGGWGAQSPLR